MSRDDRLGEDQLIAELARLINLHPDTVRIHFGKIVQYHGSKGFGYIERPGRRGKLFFFHRIVRIPEFTDGVLVLRRLRGEEKLRPLLCEDVYYHVTRNGQNRMATVVCLREDWEKAWKSLMLRYIRTEME